MAGGVKVKTHGSISVDSVITSEEVVAADLVIIAANIEVDLGKFAGKPMVPPRTLYYWVGAEENGAGAE